MEWEDYSFIVRGRIRKNVLKAVEKPRTPSQISKITKISDSHVTRALKKMESKGFVRCLTPNESKGKVYELTEKGKEILKNIRESEE